MQALRLTTSSIEIIDAPHGVYVTYAASIAGQIHEVCKLSSIPLSSRVRLGACDDEYNIAGGVFRECSYTVGDLLAQLDALPLACVCAVVEGATGWDVDVPDCFSVVQVTFFAELSKVLPAGVPADL
jgi:hypothetical protein